MELKDLFLLLGVIAFSFIIVSPLWAAEIIREMKKKRGQNE